MRSMILHLSCLVGLGHLSIAFSPHRHVYLKTQLFSSEQTTIEVCGFKDCKSRGGGTKLEKLFQTVIAEKGLKDRFHIQSCDCQGECGYGPNVVKDGQILNNIKDRDAVLQVLSDSQ